MSLRGLLMPALVYLVVLVLHRVLPARSVDGYVTDGDGRPLRYRLNGLLVFAVTIGLWAGACSLGVLRWTELYDLRWASLVGASALGLAFSAAIVLPAPATGRGLLPDLYLGRRENPRALGIDGKMYLYLVGATLLALNLLSFAAHHLALHPADPSPGVLLHLALFSFFLVDYLVFEEVHLYTYDLFAERVGFKLGWGCLVFYPYFYAAGMWSRADAPDPHASPLLLIGAALLFACGWVLSRGANLQKFFFKTRPSQARCLGVVPQRALTDGERRLLVSGFWGVSRHVNYLGEVCMAAGLALSFGAPLALLPWTYPLYYVALLVPRQLDDDRRCAAKYGALWTRYCTEVRWKIIPGVY